MFVPLRIIHKNTHAQGSLFSLNVTEVTETRISAGREKEKKKGVKMPIDHGVHLSNLSSREFFWFSFSSSTSERRQLNLSLAKYKFAQLPLINVIYREGP